MKNKNKKRPRNYEETASGVGSPSVSTATLRHRHHHQVSLPLAFPSDLSIPNSNFLRDEPPYHDSFQKALETSYEGFAVDLPTRNDEHYPHQLPQASIQVALETLEEHGFFRTDVTQPFGLGTKCAKTYVTRCLLGNSGSTYRYLGMRMFAYPWDDNRKSSADSDGGTTALASAISTMFRLNTQLMERTEHHLRELDTKRRSRGAEQTRGRAVFDIALINRMEYSTNLKKEPMMGDARCSVSWHADSSLEHYSSIAVHHTIRNHSANDAAGSWSVALRVAHHAEGPTASHRDTGGGESSLVTATPPISVSLPSGAVYYLLDDFNHHHQHTVIASGGGAGVRFSSTHRLLRESHNVSSLLERCRTVCATFHKKGPKVWRSEQLLITDMESEWLRQFFIQGQQHYDLLWEAWGEPMNRLLGYWSQLESRTKQVVDFLRAAAEGRCMSNDSAPLRSDPSPSRRERKLRERRKKAASSIEEIMGRRVNPSEMERSSASEYIYEPLATLLHERASMREKWLERETDAVFLELDPRNRPLPVPFQFDATDDVKTTNECGISPLQGSPDALRDLACALRSCGCAFDSKDSAELPELINSQSNASDKDSCHIGVDEHNVAMDWEGWSCRTFGLEMQRPWAELLLGGNKKVETRAYDLPPQLLGRRIDILESCKGMPGKSSLQNVVSIDRSTEEEPVVKRVGWCTFKRTMRYQDRQAFEADEDAHLVTRENGFGWKDDSNVVIYGWAVGERGHYAPSSDDQLTAIVRRKRSLFELFCVDTNTSITITTA